MHKDMTAVVCAVKQISQLVEIKAPRIPAAFAKQFERLRLRMVSPDSLLKLNPANVSRDRTALASVEPAIRSPG